jgi:selenocysteine lyase/cysteine desulfurase
MSAKIPDWSALREEFPTLEHWTYLDVARKAIPPRCQEQALLEYTRDVYENAGGEAWSALNTAEARASLAHLLGARPSEIAFTKNTTEGLNIEPEITSCSPIWSTSPMSGFGSTGKQKV